MPRTVAFEAPEELAFRTLDSIGRQRYSISQLVCSDGKSISLNALSLKALNAFESLNSNQNMRMNFN